MRLAKELVKVLVVLRWMQVYGFVIKPSSVVKPVRLMHLKPAVLFAGSSENEVKASKREMLSFAIPALGIYLTNPLLSNIDNAFVGRTVGTAGLAALSPATLCTDQMLYLFSFLGRATTGIVSRAYAVRDDGKGDTDAARKAASARKQKSSMALVFLYPS